MDKVVRGMGNKYRLVPHLDRAIGEGEFEWEFKFPGPKAIDDAWHPSGDCTPSIHELWEKASAPQEPRQLPIHLLKTFMVGNFWHAYLQWIVEHQLGFAGPDEIERRGKKVWGLTYEDCTMNCQGGHSENCMAWKVKGSRPWHWATGAGDIAPCTIPGLDPFAVDFKTMNARVFGTGPDANTMAKWECQGNIYLDFFDLEEIVFVGICKDSPHDMKEWIFAKNQPLIDAIYSKWKLVGACLEEGIEPPVDEEIELPLQGAIV